MTKRMTRAVELQRGEVWWVEGPDVKRRPHLILHRPKTLGVLPRIIAVPTTRTVRAIATEVPLDTGDGMPEACVLSLDNITLIERSWCRKRITHLGPVRMAEVCAALLIATGC